jgi:hypothetical protein
LLGLGQTSCFGLYLLVLVACNSRIKGIRLLKFVAASGFIKICFQARRLGVSDR